MAKSRLQFRRFDCFQTIPRRVASFTGYSPGLPYDEGDEMVRRTRKRIFFSLSVGLLFLLTCLMLCKYREVQSENRIEKVVQDMIYNNVSIKYVTGNDKSYYQITASEELIQLFDLQNWVLKDAENTLMLDKYLVIRIAEKYEVVLFSNQIAKIYDYYGYYETCEPESLYYMTSTKLQKIIDFLDQNARCSPSYNVGFEN